MKNILITYISAIRETMTKNNTINYASDLGEITAILTNEAAIRYLDKYLTSSGKKIDIIYAFCTTEVENKVLPNFNDDILEELFGSNSVDENKENTTLKYFKSCVKSISPQTVVENISVLTDNAAEIVDVMKRISSDDKIFLDITGGLRDAVFNITLLSRFAEFNGNSVEKVIYSSLIPNNEVKDFTPSFKLMELMNGISEFTSFASTDKLLNYFSDSNNESIKALISDMHGFTDAITLGKTNNIEDELINLRNNIDTFEKTESNETSEKILKYLINLIKGKFFKEQNIDYLSIIEWCLDNKLVQQALTLYTEKIPKYLFEKKLISCTEEKMCEMMKTKKKETEIYYHIFGSDFLSASELPDSPEGKMKRFFNSGNDVENEEKIKELINSSDDDILKNGLSKYLKLLKWIKQECVNSFSSLDIKVVKKKKIYPPAKLGLSVVWEEISRQSQISNFNDLENSKIVNAFLYASTDVIEDNSLNKMLRFVKNFKKCYKEKQGYTICNSDIMEDICNSYVFFKTMRNEINHASDTEKFSEEDKQYFKNLGFEIDISVNSIIKDIRNSIIKIRDAAE